MKPWAVKCEIAFPCATQNELNHADAMSLINVGCQIIIEGKQPVLGLHHKFQISCGAFGKHMRFGWLAPYI